MAYSYKQLMDLWVQAGGSRAGAPLAAAVAMAESGGNPNAVGKNTNGTLDRGLWQINSIHGSYSTTDALANARAAVKLSKNGSEWKWWVAYTTGRYKSFLQDVSARSSSAGPSVSTSGIPGLTGGNGKPYQLSKNIKGAWDTVQDMFGFSSLDEYNNFVHNWNVQSKAMARKYGVDSERYQKWLELTLPSVKGAQSDVETGLNPGEIAEQFTVLLKADTWLRVGYGIVGAIAIIGGVMILVSVIADKSGATKAVGQVVGIVGPAGKVGKAVSMVKGK